MNTAMRLSGLEFGNEAPTLSILIATMPARARKFERLLPALIAQVTGRRAEILVDRDGGSLGSKRQRMNVAARGHYVACVDDDDLVPDDYVERVLAACARGKDCCSLEGRIVMTDGHVRTFLHSIEYDGWSQSTDVYGAEIVYFRTPNHLNAVRRQLAVEAGFADMGYGEDHNFSKRLRPLLKTEARVPGMLYHYLERNSEAYRVAERARILVKWATRGRPALFGRTLFQHVTKLSGKNDVHFLVSVDHDDQTSEQVKKDLLASGVHFTMVTGSRETEGRGKVAAINADLSAEIGQDCFNGPFAGEPFDLLLVAADDVVPTEKDYDERLVCDVLRRMPKLDGVLVYDDGYQRTPEPGKLSVATVPILGRRWYAEQGTIYCPEYTSLFCDEELTAVAAAAGKFYHVPRVLLRHEWVGGGPDRDALLERNESFYKADEQVFLRRRAAGFPKERTDDGAPR